MAYHNTKNFIPLVVGFLVIALIGQSLCKPASKLDGLSSSEVRDAKQGKFMTEAALLSIVKESDAATMAKIVAMAEKYGTGPLRCLHCLPFAKKVIACFNSDLPETFAGQKCPNHDVSHEASIRKHVQGAS